MEEHKINPPPRNVPRDFDLSPYFATIKPTVEKGFNFKAMPIRDNLDI